MAGSDLPFPNSSRQKNDSLFGGARFGRRKRTYFMLLVVVLFFILWFNSDFQRVSTISNSENTNIQAQEDISIKEPPTVLQDEVDEQEESLEQEEQEQIAVEETPATPLPKFNPPPPKANSPPPAVVHKPTIIDPDNYTPPKTIYEQQAQHFKYFMIIASKATAESRRQLIRKTYFGIEDNLEPCMKRDNGMNYLFWVYGNLPHSHTAARRLYETEEMEWNDLEKVNQESFNQDEVLKWAETTLKSRKITYDYLIIQDGYSLIQLNYIQQTLQAEAGKLTVQQNGKSAKELVWVSPANKNTLIAGSDAIAKLFEREDDIKDIITEQGNTLMTNFYEFYRSVTVQLNFVTAPKEVERLKELKQDLPIFITELNRFATWENHVESIPEMAISVANLYQNSDFISVANTLNIVASSICKSLDKADIAVMTSSYIYPDSCMEPSASLAADNKRQYALAHNYAFVARSTEFAQQNLRAITRKPVWGKVDAVQKVLPKYDWIFWMDMDAVILNPDHTVQGILDQLRTEYPGGPRAFESTIDLVIAKPKKQRMINAGVFFLRNTEWAQKFLNAVQNSKNWYNQAPSFEQGAMWDLIQLPGYKEHVMLLENDDHTFNTMPQSYIPGDFIVHFAPDKCPNDAVLQGLKAAQSIQQGKKITSFDF